MASFCMVVFGESFAFSSVTTGDVRVQTSELEICILVYLFLRNFHNFGNSRFVLFRGYCGASRSRGGGFALPLDACIEWSKFLADRRQIDPINDQDYLRYSGLSFDCIFCFSCRIVIYFARTSNYTVCRK